MKLLRILFIFLAIYLIRRFFRAFRELQKKQQIQQEEINLMKSQAPKEKTVDADYEVLDP